ncbi:uncharacterized protein FIBRA_04224 [Fibroporia radiculosa]|uniref:Uncharacterized protein n=1 Tax=Fibroporia radiculosa TaxID=599839 RepID=J4HWF0_9APHY|nr:uncharacterized protein FIBRA_04224 [Fibroporia radiculosa]CCM02147.1 predicted protein [Fibroporia radiculosa]
MSAPAVLAAVLVASHLVSAAPLVDLLLPRDEADSTTASENSSWVIAVVVIVALVILGVISTVLYVCIMNRRRKRERRARAAAAASRKARRHRDPRRSDSFASSFSDEFPIGLSPPSPAVTVSQQSSPRSSRSISPDMVKQQMPVPVR